jgi:hypothetical protein
MLNQLPKHIVEGGTIIIPISERKLIALRKNAQKSTGPKSPLGKFRSSRNALKHGLYSKFDICRAVEFLPRKAQLDFLLSLIAQDDIYRLKNRPRK